MQPETYETEQPVTNIFRNLFFKYLAYWPLFIVLITVYGIVAVLYIKLKVPVYELKSTMIITDEQKGINDSKMIESLDVFRSKTLVDNEIEVIRSKTLAQQVVKDLYLYAPVTEDRLIKRSAYLSSPVIVEAKNPDAVPVVKRVDFSWNAETRQVILEGKSYPLDQWISTHYGVVKFLPNPNYQANTTEQFGLYFSLVPVAYAADDLASEMSVSSADKLSTVVNISLKDEVPLRGKNILNVLITEYNKATVQDKNILAANTLAFVEDRLHFVVQELDSIESNLQKYKTKNHVVDINTQGRLYLENVGSNDQKIGDISMQLAILNQVEQHVAGKESSGGIVPSTLGVTDPVLSNLLEKLYSAELDYEKMRKIAPENNPLVLSITDQINKIKPNILENIRSQRKGLMAGRSDLTATNNKYSSKLSVIPTKERELLEISRQQAIKNDIYTFLLQKREEAAISYASAVANSRLVDNAQTSRNPVSPDKLIVCLIALIAALASGVGYISVKDFLNVTIDSRADIENNTRTTVLAELAKADSQSPVVIGNDNHTLIAEQFRQLRTLLGYLGISSRKKKILVTSTMADEGKSFVAVNLALSLALANKKVVLVDLDLRRPSLAAMLEMPNEDGMSQYLQGEKKIETIIKRSKTHSNLYVVPSGPVPANPSELLLNSKLQEFFTYLEGAFDYIIVDTSPVNPVTDACILSPYCDATLYIVRQGVTPKMFIQKLDQYSHIRSLKNMAIVLNAVKRKKFGKRGYGDYTDYSYLEDTKSLLKKKNLIKTT